MVAVAAQIVHFLPQLVAVRRHFGEGRRSPGTSASSIGSFKGQFVSCVSRRFSLRRPEFRSRGWGGFGWTPASARSELIFVAAD